MSEERKQRMEGEGPQEGGGRREGEGGQQLPVVRVEGPAEGVRPGMDRRHALKIMALAAATPALTSCEPLDGPTDGSTEGAAGFPEPPSGGNPLARGDAWDPDLVSPEVPWQPILTGDELESVAALVDVIIPADQVSPSASQVGVPDFIDEWVSAPYPAMERDRVLVRGGLVWLDREAARRFGAPPVDGDGGGESAGPRFRDLTPEQQTAICDDLAYLPDAAPEHEAGARFFATMRNLTATAYYTTEEGMEDIGYVGNVPLPAWDPPPPEALAHLSLDPSILDEAG